MSDDGITLHGITLAFHRVEHEVIYAVPRGALTVPLPPSQTVPGEVIELLSFGVTVVGNPLVDERPLVTLHLCGTIPSTPLAPWQTITISDLAEVPEPLRPYVLRVIEAAQRRIESSS